MRFISTFVVALALTAPALAQVAAERAAVRTTRPSAGWSRRYVDAREARDPKAVAALFTADADQLVSCGEWRLGSRHRRQRQPRVVGAERRHAAIDVERVRFVATGRRGRGWALLDHRMGEGDDRRMWSTFVMVRENGRLADRGDPQHAARRAGGRAEVSGAGCGSRTRHASLIRNGSAQPSSNQSGRAIHQLCRTDPRQRPGARLVALLRVVRGQPADAATGAERRHRRTDPAAAHVRSLDHHWPEADPERGRLRLVLAGAIPGSSAHG